MKLCRFDNNKLGIVEGDQVLDVTKALSVIPELKLTDQGLVDVNSSGGIQGRSRWQSAEILV